MVIGDVLQAKPILISIVVVWIMAVSKQIMKAIGPLPVNEAMLMYLHCYIGKKSIDWIGFSWSM